MIARENPSDSALPNQAPRTLSLYIHFPYCLSKCPYCDFNSHVRPDLAFLPESKLPASHLPESKSKGDGASNRAARAAEQRWQESLLLALDRQMARLGYPLGLAQTHSVSSIFFGGGTPSLIDPMVVAEILTAIKQRFRLDAGCEITLEANPNSSESQRFSQFRQAGINRLSLGVQSLDDRALRFLGRGHSAAEALHAIQAAAQNFDFFSFDLIYARPEQTLADWHDELRRALQLGSSHLSLYQLTIEENTKFFHAFARGDFTLPDDDLAGEFYETTQAIMTAAGLPAYEISNHAKAGHESRHNLGYWHYGDYLGVGPGAHGRMTDAAGEKFALAQAKLPETWQNHIAQGGDGLSEYNRLSRRDRFAEALMMGLRLTTGISMTHLADEGNFSRDKIDGWLASVRCQALFQENFLQVKGDFLSATAAGRQRLNAVLREMLAEEIV
ncbi:MAG: radical SAM family heme chaperone HemW [Candidatus Symbiobacter sp.]|nr:radical SAM family heme chaperone HemW [Candidatus Symbiobacter sp.]